MLEGAVSSAIRWEQDASQLPLSPGGESPLEKPSFIPGESRPCCFLFHPHSLTQIIQRVISAAWNSRVGFCATCFLIQLHSTEMPTPFPPGQALRELPLTARAE